MLYAQIHLTLPAWLHELPVAESYPSDEDKMRLAIELARLNVVNRSGGPFGAALFDANHRLISVGVNRVIPQACSLAHGEIMAYMTGQQRAQRNRLNMLDDGTYVGPVTLATSGQPCCQCYGATVWAGIDRLLIAATSEDVETIAGFDEGPLPADWQGELAKRGVTVVEGLLRENACEVLTLYRDEVGIVY